VPAISVDDVLVLPRLPALDPAVTRFRRVSRLTTAPLGYETNVFAAMIRASARKRANLTRERAEASIKMTDHLRPYPPAACRWRNARIARLWTGLSSA
jgi:hypothetical protein